jgi:glycerol-1-phosphate dehydrogenase [NAD(P)+]
LHGHQVGVASIITEYLHNGDGGQWRAIRDALKSIDAPTTAAEIGISDDDFLEALTTAHEIRDRYTILGNGVSLDAAYETATVTGVIERE